MRKQSIGFFAMFLMVVLYGLGLYAMPANPKMQKIKQIDGRELSFTLRGDESINWAESIDGYTLIHNSEGSFVYAQLGERGDLEPSVYLAVDPEFRTSREKTFLTTLPYNLFYSEAQIESMKGRHKLSADGSNPNKFPTVGQTRLLVILVEFSDKSFSFTQSQFDNMCNQVGYDYNGATGSAKDYFFDNSSGLLDAEFDVVGPVTLPNTSAYYANNNMQRMQLFVHSALGLADSLVDYSIYDNDNNGVVDNVHFIFAGLPRSSTGNPNEIWPHASSVYGTLIMDGVGFGTYSCSAEKRTSIYMDGIGTLCHETSHIFGLPDFYDTDYEDSDGQLVHPGIWDIMASGSYNNNSNTPPYYHAYERELVNWGEIVEIDISIPSEIILPALCDSLVGYKIMLSSNEFYMLENRMKKSWDAYVPGQGLLIMHGDQVRLDRWPNRNDVNANPSNFGLIVKTPSGNINDTETANSVFPGNNNVRLLTHQTNPGTSLKNGTMVERPITHIRYINDSTIALRVMSDLPFILNLGIDHTTLRGVSADLNAAIVYQNDPIIEKGFYYHTDESSVNPDDGIKMIDNSTDTLINVQLDALTPSTTYYFRPFASTASGEELGDLMQFSTMDGLGIVTTGNVSNIQDNEAELSATLIDLGDGDFIEKGVVLTASTLEAPTIDDMKFVSTDPSSGMFTVSAEGLDVQTTYYFRAFVTTSLGTKYGARKSFVTTFPAIFDNNIVGTQDFCNIGQPEEIIGDTPTGGKSNFTYLWEQKTLSTGWEPATQINTGLNYQPEELHDSTFYRRIVISDGSIKDTSNIVSININRTWGGELINSRDTIYEESQTGTIRLMNHKGSVVHWERKFNDEDWTIIEHTAVTYNEVPESIGHYTYRVKVQLGVCEAKYSTENEFEVLASSIEEIDSDLSLSIYPNPSNGIIRLDSNYGLEGRVQVINLLGKVVFETETSLNNAELNLGDIQSGTYFIKIMAGGSQVMKKIIINK